MPQVIYRGKIAGSFYGFDGDQLFKLDDGSYWIQAQYTYWYHYEYRPDVTITAANGQYILTVAGHSSPVRSTSDVIESSIDGAFNGWNGNSIYKLINGQVWQQSAYHYEYTYAYNPEVLVYNTGGGYKMKVEGTEAEVRRIR